MRPPFLFFCNHAKIDPLTYSMLRGVPCPMKPIIVLDTTLRDGAQGEGVVFSVDDKLHIARALDGLDIPYIEGGNPAANPKDAEFFRLMNEKKPLSFSRLCAFGSTRRAHTPPAEDAGLQGLLKSGAQVITLFGKSSRGHVEEVLRCTLEENLAMIEESVAYLIAAGREVFFDGEHFFDGYAEDPAYAMATLEAALRGGASCLVLCDTNGGAMPDEVAAITKEVVTRFSVSIGIHCHNDCGMAAANTIMGVKAGATHVQGTMCGVGERCGNGDLTTILPVLELKLGYSCLREGNMAQLTPTARYISEVMNLPLGSRAPFVGSSAFAHKAGMHIDGVTKNSAAFEHIPPEAVGNLRRFLLSDQTGRTGLLNRLQTIIPGITRDSQELAAIGARLKRKELRGYTFENADGSFALMVLDTLGKRQSFYEVLDFHVLSSKEQGENSAQAYIKISVEGRTEINAAEGDGPVNALDKALRKALAVFYPPLSNMRLKDFSVRVLDSGGTASTVRVLIESTDGTHIWNTVGVSSNIIQACFKALCDSVDYLLTYYGQ